MIKLNLEKVRFSKKDKEKGIKIPEILTPDLAEDIGIHLGDGSLYRCNSKRTSYEFKHTSNLNEREYLNHILNLKEKLYNLKKYRVQEYKHKSELNLVFNSLAIATFYKHTFNIPVGSKAYTNKIPNNIKNSKYIEIISSCLRDIVDTDFYFGYLNKGKVPYPRLTASFSSFNLVKDLEYLFNLLEIKPYVQYYRSKIINLK